MNVGQNFYRKSELLKIAESRQPKVFNFSQRKQKFYAQGQSYKPKA